MFPLYETLKKNLPNKDLTASQKTELVSRIETLDSDTHGLVYALIRSYASDHEKEESALPYEGKKIDKNGTLFETDIVYELKQFPNELRQLLYKFVMLHCNKMKEDDSASSRQEDTPSSRVAEIPQTTRKKETVLTEPLPSVESDKKKRKKKE